MIFVCGSGAVSPAGWGVAPLREVLARGEPLPPKEVPRPGLNSPLLVRPVPPASPRPNFVAHARLRRTSPIAQHTLGAALEALGSDASRLGNGSFRLGVVLCVMSGCVNYSRRFYDETLKDPSTASPLVFPETVFNAPASHLAALLGTTAINYTLVGDPGTFLQGIALGADWLSSDRVDGCLVVGAEELDWLTTEAFRLFERKAVVSEGAGALYLRREAGRSATVRLAAITQAHSFSKMQSRAQAAQRARNELGDSVPHTLLCDGLQGLPRADSAEQKAWHDWTGPRLSPKVILGEGLMAAGAWQCVAGVDALQQGRYAAANVSVVGCNQQAIAARFVTEEVP
jgi:3-oxoacyl-[acyl-carrier-protein] synthase II